MRVAGREFSEDIIGRIRRRVQGDAKLSRAELSREVCEWLDRRGHDGRVKDMSCRVALLKLQRRGVIELPPSRPVAFGGVDPHLGVDPAWPTLNATLAELGPVWLVPVAGEERSSQWRAMFREFHPLGDGPACGAQMRYLVASGAGLIGGLSFSSAAWRLTPRDAWIGWNEGARQVVPCAGRCQQPVSDSLTHCSSRSISGSRRAPAVECSAVPSFMSRMRRSSTRTGKSLRAIARGSQ